MTERRAHEALRVAHLDTGREWRGGQAQVLQLMQGLAQRGITNVLLAPPGPLFDRARESGFAVHEWAPVGDWDLVALLHASSRLRAWRPDVVHAHTARAHAVGVPAARRSGARAVIVSRRVAGPVATHPLSELKYRMPVDRYLCVSRAVMAALRASGVPESRLALVPSGVRLTSPPAAMASLRSLLGVADDTPVIGTLAALTPEKRHEDLLAAAPRVLAEVPEARFVWLGDGLRRSELEQLRGRLGLDARVFLLGFRADARALMAQCTVAVLASDLEGIATALIEAQADGVPVVGTAVGGVPEVISEGENGWLVPPRDPAALGAALVQVLKDPGAARCRAAQARITVMQFDIERTVERTLEEYERALGAGPGAA